MKDRTQKPQPRRLITKKEVRELTGLMLSGEAALYLGVFVTVCTLGAAILIIHGVVNASGNPMDTAYSIVTDLWHAGAAALVLTVATIGISKAAKFAAIRR